MSDAFRQQRDEAFDKVLALIDRHIQTAAPVLLLDIDEISEDSMRRSAEKEIWSLFRRGILYLKNGAPDKQPGSITEALSKASLRSGGFAAALGIKPPHFEPLYFSVDYTTGAEAALFYCLRLIDAAEGDLAKSKQIIHQKMLLETPTGETPAIKKQMAFSFNVLAETYGSICHDLKTMLDGL
jgi:hypothetical protein